ncbi:MAG: hypothetical protein L6R19_07445 [Alphaproteobacteria bacterium]|nr:hypothetical protein [Alphaproteobacteria bacterium]
MAQVMAAANGMSLGLMKLLPTHSGVSASSSTAMKPARVPPSVRASRHVPASPIRPTKALSRWRVSYSAKGSARLAAAASVSNSAPYQNRLR